MDNANDSPKGDDQPNHAAKASAEIGSNRQLNRCSGGEEQQHRLRLYAVISSVVRPGGCRTKEHSIRNRSKNAECDCDDAISEQRHRSRHNSSNADRNDRTDSAQKPQRREQPCHAKGQWQDRTSYLSLNRSSSPGHHRQTNDTQQPNDDPNSVATSTVPLPAREWREEDVLHRACINGPIKVNRSAECWSLHGESR